MRVIIPFGTRKITGFILEKSNYSQFDHLKEIIEILDVSPVLTKELLNIGQWLADETLSLYITTYQAMLPQVLKAKYDKEIVRVNDAPLTIELEQLFKNRRAIAYDDVMEQLNNLRQLQQFIEAGSLRIKRSEEHTSELQSRGHLVCRLLLEKKKF